MMSGWLPTPVQIGALSYNIVRQAKILSTNGSDASGNAEPHEVWGQIQYAETQIVLDQAVSVQYERVLLWHELLHGVLFNAGHEQVSEDLIDALAAGIVDMLRRNPHLVTYTMLTP